MVESRAAGRAYALVSVLVGYIAIVNHVPLAPWNQLAAAGSQLLSTLVGVLPLLAALAALALGHARALGVLTAWAFVWLALQLRQWWLPYLVGPTPLHSDFGWYFDGGYSETLRVLPVIEGRPVPDAQHLGLELLTACAAFSLFEAWRELRATTHGDT